MKMCACGKKFEHECDLWSANACMHPEIKYLAKAAPSENPKDKFGAAKPPLHLIPPVAQLYEAQVMDFGERKYGPYNWREHPVKLTVYVAAAMRHLLCLLDGEDVDPESGAPHEAHARACMGILLDARANGKLVDDRPSPGAAARVIAELTKKVWNWYA